MGSKRALLVGINYKDDPENALRGCWNDAERMGECLVSRYGFPKEMICTLVDRPGISPHLMPTGEIIREKLEQLTRGLKWGDCIVFHFSGHGVQLPPEGEPDETGMKEAIVPVDMNLITDDDFRILVDKIPDGVAFTFIADCCHSGGLIAHSEQQVGSVHTKPTSLLSSLGPQQQESEEDDVVVDEEAMVQILASMLGSVSSPDPSMPLLEILAVMEAANSAQQELSLLDLLALYVASQQHNMTMADILESMLAEQENAPEKDRMQKSFSTSTRSLHRSKQLKKDRIQHMLGATKAHNIQRLVRTNYAHRSMSRDFSGPNECSGGHYPPQVHNRFSQHNSEPLVPHRHYGYPPPDAGNYYNDSHAPWQHPRLEHSVSAPGAYEYSYHADSTPCTSASNPFGTHPSMQRWGSDTNGSHDRHNGQFMQGEIAQNPPPWAKPTVETGYVAPVLGQYNHESARSDFYGKRAGAWSYGGGNLGQGSGGYEATIATSKYRKKRSMPVQAVTRMLSARTGRRVETGNIRANLYDMFGDKSSVTCKAVVQTVLDGLTNKGGSSSRAILKRISSKSIEFLSAKLHEPNMRIEKYLSAMRSFSGATPSALKHTPKRPDRCVLITACQSDELANEHMQVIQGAFTKVILDIVDEHKGPLDNHRLVYESRHRLAKAPYKQHPCLYSTPQQAHNVFICY